MVITGVSGGEHGANGFVAAIDQATGKEVWRFWTVPKPGQPGSETWKGKDIDHGGAPTWFTGSYDAGSTWSMADRKPQQGIQRRRSPGRQPVRELILALDRQTGKLKWYYQFTPHDLWDWDATQTSVAIDAAWQGAAAQAAAARESQHRQEFMQAVFRWLLKDITHSSMRRPRPVAPRGAPARRSRRG